MGPSTTFEKRTDLSDPKDESKEPKVKRERESREINLAEEIQKPSQMAIERPITIECRPDGIFFPKQAGIVTARPIPSSDPEMDKTILETMIGCVRAWNVAGRNMYWSPWVRVKVTPGGEASYEHLVRLMKSQNVRIERASE